MNKSKEGYFELDGVRYYPRPSFHIGAIIESTKPIDPGKIYGGVWEEFGKGKVIVGVDSSDEDFNEAFNSGGEKSHKLTVNEMPEHSHSVSFQGVTKQVMVDTAINDIGWGVHFEEQGGYRSNPGNINITGGNHYHNNMPPYIVAYRYRRIA